MHLTGSFLDYLIVFWAGVLVSFTPCVYPVMPMTASFIAGMNVSGSRWMGFFLSLIYVLGMAITYCTLGLIAALGGHVFGSFQNQPATYIVIGIFFVLFGLAMLELIRLPMLGIDFRHRLKPKNFWMVIVFGMATGLAVGACTAPILGSLLVYVAKKQNVFHGASLLFVFSYGVGASLILVGTFSGLLGSLPRSGFWMVRVKQICGVFLLLAAVYFFIKAGGWIE